MKKIISLSVLLSLACISIFAQNNEIKLAQQTDSTYALPENISFEVNDVEIADYFLCANPKDVFMIWDETENEKVKKIKVNSRIVIPF